MLNKGILMAYVINYKYICNDINCRVIPYYSIYIITMLFNVTCQFIILLQLLLVIILLGNNIDVQMMSYYISLNMSNLLNI